MRLSPLFLKCQLNQAADQIIGAHTALHHQLGIHADAGKARQRIDLVENNSIILYKEIYSGQSLPRDSKAAKASSRTKAAVSAGIRAGMYRSVLSSSYLAS